MPTPSRARSPLAPAAGHAPRRPQDTVLHRLVREHYATFVAHTEATYAAPLPRYVTDAFERYLACGDFCRGFVRCHEGPCRHDVLVAFSCNCEGCVQAAARVACATRGGNSIFVGPDQSPLAGQGDRTQDGGVIRDRTPDNVYMT